MLKGHEKGVLLKLLGDMLYAGDRKGEIKLWKVGRARTSTSARHALGAQGAI